MDPVTRELREARVPLGPGRLLRLRLISGPEGEEEPGGELWISLGWADGREDWRHALGPIPEAALGRVRDALEALEVGP